MLWDTRIIMRERIRLKITLIMNTVIKAPPRRNRNSLLPFGIASSIARCVIIGASKATAPARALMRSARIIFGRYFFMYAEAKRRCRILKGSSSRSSCL